MMGYWSQSLKFTWSQRGAGSGFFCFLLPYKQNEFPKPVGEVALVLSVFYLQSVVGQ